MKYYVIVICEGLGIEKQGPYHTESDCDEAAKQAHIDNGDDSTIHWLTIDADAMPDVGDYSCSFFD